MDQVTDGRCPSPMALLRAGVPLSLLLDLAFGPDSAQVLATEPRRSRASRTTPCAPPPRRTPEALR